MTALDDISDPTDRTIAKLVMRGEANKSIAAALGLSESAVKWRLHRLFERFGVNSRTQLAIKLHGAANFR